MIRPGFQCTIVLISLVCLLDIKPSTAGHSDTDAEDKYHYYLQLWWKHHNKCPMNARKASKLESLLGTLFPGLFVGLTELKAVVSNNGLSADISNATSILELPPMDLPTTTPMETATHVVSTIEPATPEPTTPGGPGPRANFGCCEIITQVIKPVTLRQDGRSYNVVHLDNGAQDQLVTTSSCRNNFARCNTSGRCVDRKGYNWVLVYDLTVNYYPPVRFIPLQINVGCECL